MGEVYQIDKSIYLILASALLGCLLIIFYVFDGNLERVSIVVITLILISIMKKSFFNTRAILIFFMTFICSSIISNIAIYYYVVNYRENYIKEYNIDEEKHNETAVIILGEGEYPTYTPIMILKNLYKEERLIEKTIAPIKVFNKKIAYEDLGRSKYNDICKEISDTLQIRLGMNYHLYITFLESKPNFYKEIIEIKKSYDKIILVPLILSKTKRYEELLTAISNDTLKYEGDIKLTPLLWNSDKLANQITRKVLYINDENDISLSGIVIIDSKNYINNRDENIFYKKVADKLVDYGLNSNKITIMRGDITKDKLHSSVHRLQEEGTNNIMVLSISSISDDIEKKHILKEIISDISREELIRISYIDGWGIGEDLLNELEYKIRLANLK